METFKSLSSSCFLAITSLCCLVLVSFALYCLALGLTVLIKSENHVPALAVVQ